MSQSTELAIRAVTFLADAVGIGGSIASIAGAPVAGGLVATASTAAKAIASELEKRSESAKTARAQRLVENLSMQLQDCQERIKRLEESDVNVFLHIWNQAITDEDERKLTIQQHFISWFMLGNREPSQVRLLAEAIRVLTHEELMGFLIWANGASGNLPSTKVFDQTVVRERLQRAGLIPGGGILVQGRMAPLGEALHGACRKMHSDDEWHKLGRAQRY